MEDRRIRCLSGPIRFRDVMLFCDLRVCSRSSPSRQFTSDCRTSVTGHWATDATDATERQLPSEHTCCMLNCLRRVAESFDVVDLYIGGCRPWELKDDARTRCFSANSSSFWMCRETVGCLLSSRFSIEIFLDHDCTPSPLVPAIKSSALLIETHRESVPSGIDFSLFALCRLETIVDPRIKGGRQLVTPPLSHLITAVTPPSNQFQDINTSRSNDTFTTSPRSDRLLDNHSQWCGRIDSSTLASSRPSTTGSQIHAKAPIDTWSETWNQHSPASIRSTILPLHIHSCTR